MVSQILMKHTVKSNSMYFLSIKSTISLICFLTILIPYYSKTLQKRIDNHRKTYNFPSVQVFNLQKFLFFKYYKYVEHWLTLNYPMNVLQGNQDEDYLCMIIETCF